MSAFVLLGAWLATGELGLDTSTVTSNSSESQPPDPGVLSGDSNSTTPYNVGLKISSIIKDLPTLKNIVIFVCGFTAFLITCLVVKVFRSGKKRRKTRKYDLITTPAERVEMAPLNEDNEDDEDSTLFDVKYSMLPAVSAHRERTRCSQRQVVNRPHSRGSHPMHTTMLHPAAPFTLNGLHSATTGSPLAALPASHWERMGQLCVLGSENACRQEPPEGHYTTLRKQRNRPPSSHRLQHYQLHTQNERGSCVWWPCSETACHRELPKGHCITRTAKSPPSSLHPANACSIPRLKITERQLLRCMRRSCGPVHKS
ncbi:F174B protein, partial [Polypterus senegalus]